MLDPNDVRVDLLKFREKAYLAYPEGSEERKNFLRVILQNELQIAQSEMPYEMIDTVLKGKKTMFWTSLKDFLTWFLLSLICLFGGEFLYSSSKFLTYFMFGLGGACMFLCGQTAVNYWKYLQATKKVEQYSNDMKRYTAKLTNEIKKLNGPFRQ